VHRLIQCQTFFWFLKSVNGDIILQPYQYNVKQLWANATKLKAIFTKSDIRLARKITVYQQLSSVLHNKSQFKMSMVLTQNSLRVDTDRSVHPSMYCGHLTGDTWLPSLLFLAISQGSHI